MTHKCDVCQHPIKPKRVRDYFLYECPECHSFYEPSTRTNLIAGVVMVIFVVGSMVLYNALKIKGYHVFSPIILGIILVVLSVLGKIPVCMILDKIGYLEYRLMDVK